MIDVVFHVDIESANDAFPEWAKVFSKRTKVPAIPAKGTEIWFSLDSPELEGSFGHCKVHDVTYYEGLSVFLVTTISSGKASFDWDENEFSKTWIESDWSPKEGTEISPLCD